MFVSKGHAYLIGMDTMKFKDGAEVPRVRLLDPFTRQEMVVYGESSCKHFAAVEFDGTPVHVVVEIEWIWFKDRFKPRVLSVE